jgi:surface carbohydrate biosynthesis protein
MKNVDFVIYYEHVAREWNSVVRLKRELNSRGLNGIILPVHYYKYWSLIRYRPKIIIVPYLYSKKNDQHLMFLKVYGDCLVLNLHSEQLHDETTKNFQMPHDSYAESAYHIAWGEKFASALMEFGVDSKLIFKTGSIRNDDVASLKNIEQSVSDINRLKVLIPTAFSKTFVSKEYIDKLTSLDVIDKNMYLEKLKYTKDARDELFKNIFLLSKKHKDVDFTFRPHPYVEIDTYKQTFLEINKLNKLPFNISVKREGSIQEAIVGSDKIIAWYTSTCMDAYILGKNVVIHEPTQTPEYMKIDFLEYFKTTKTVSDLSAHIMDRNGYENISAADEYIKSVYGVIDGNSCAKVAYVVDKLVAEKNYQFRFSLMAYFTHLLKTLMIDSSKLVFLKLGFLHKLRPFYEGILEDKKLCLKKTDVQIKKCFYYSRLDRNGYSIIRKN